MINRFIIECSSSIEPWNQPPSGTTVFIVFRPKLLNQRPFFDLDASDKRACDRDEQESKSNEITQGQTQPDKGDN